MKEHKDREEELQKRDHRVIGKKYDLFNFHPLSPGCAFFFPHGAIIYNKLIEFIRHEYVVRGFTEVVTPNMYDVKVYLFIFLSLIKSDINQIV